MFCTIVAVPEDTVRKIPAVCVPPTLIAMLPGLIIDGRTPEPTVRAGAVSVTMLSVGRDHDPI